MPNMKINDRNIKKMINSSQSLFEQNKCTTMSHWNYSDMISSRRRECCNEKYQSNIPMMMMIRFRLLPCVYICIFFSSLTERWEEKKLWNIIWVRMSNRERRRTEGLLPRNKKAINWSSFTSSRFLGFVSARSTESIFLLFVVLI